MMLVNPLVVIELRLLFKSGATPSALIRRIAERHAGEPMLDALVRAYFREAFHVPMIRVGPEQVKQIAEGCGLAILNVTVLPRMTQARREWDTEVESAGCWMNTTTTDEAAPELIPELAGSWDRMDDEAKQFIRRIIANARSSHENANALAALAERLQQQVPLAVTRRAQGA